MSEDVVPSGDESSGQSAPVPWARRRTALLLLGGIMLTFVLWTVLLIFLFDPSILAHLPGQHGTVQILLYAAIPFSLGLAGAASDQFFVPKSWLARSFYVASVLLFEVFVVAIAINAADNQLPSNHKNALGGVAFCCGSLSLMALVWWLELSPSNPFLPRNGLHKVVSLGETQPSRYLWEMSSRGIPLIFATALLVIPPLATLVFVAVYWRDESKLVYIYPAVALMLFGAFILLCVAGVRAWRRGDKSA